MVAMARRLGLKNRPTVSSPSAFRTRALAAASLAASALTASTLTASALTGPCPAYSDFLGSHIFSGGLFKFFGREIETGFLCQLLYGFGILCLYYTSHQIGIRLSPKSSGRLHCHDDMLLMSMVDGAFYQKSAKGQIPLAMGGTFDIVTKMTCDHVCYG
jgi:hypothetical protein